MAVLPAEWRLDLYTCERDIYMFEVGVSDICRPQIFSPKDNTGSVLIA